MNLFLIVFSLLLLGFWWFSRKIISEQFLAPFHIHKKWVLTFDIIYALSLIISIWYRYQTTQVPLIGTVVLRIHYVLMGMIWLILVIGIFNYLMIKIASRTKKSDFNADRRLFFKRKLSLAGMGVLGTATSIGAYQAVNPVLEKVLIPLPKSHKDLAGLKIVQLSDVHIGPTLKIDFLKDVVEKANSVSPDIIAITGDLIDGRVPALANDLQELRNLKARLGVYFITGNHEYYWNVAEWTDFIRSLGIKVLENEHEILKFKDRSFAIGGVTDYRANRFGKQHQSSPSKAIKNIDSNIYKILLAHQPQSCYEAESVGWHLQLSGHTHGGQGFPWNILVSMVQPYLKGLYDHKSMKLYVNRGTGYWGPPYRLGLPGEITEIILT